MPDRELSILLHKCMWFTQVWTSNYYQTYCTIYLLLLKQSLAWICRRYVCWMSVIRITFFLFLNGPFPASFSLFSSFQYTVDSKQMFDINKILPMTGFEPQASGIALPTEPQPLPNSNISLWHGSCPCLIFNYIYLISTRQAVIW